MVLVVVMTGILSLIGSGGDGGNFERVPDDYTLLPYYALRISGVDDPLDAFATGISLDLTLAGTPYRLRINPQALEGGFSCDVTTEVCVLADVDTATQVDVNDESTPPLFGDYRITILEPLLFQNADIPSDGTVDLTQDGGFGTISIEAVFSQP
ncbi:MAG: hypothetical protein PVI92_10415 [Chromatiales bacterium]|jgi:hypothetical protein